MSLGGYRQALKWYAVALVVLIVDQLTKLSISQQFNYGEVLPVTGFFNLTLVHNTGAAFSFLSEAGGWQRWFFAVIAVAVSVLLVIWIARVAAQRRCEALALGLVLGGALGNLYDRVLLGYVVDFLDFYYQSYHFPAFNVADSAITVGAIVLIADGIWGNKSAAEQQ